MRGQQQQIEVLTLAAQHLPIVGTARLVLRALCGGELTTETYDPTAWAP